ncbi:hypothetical protein FQN53_005440 [Emmonsiellopsis sp. PD_33]|nr:hypothetical protein FQN53_005440 [Emmonsiellopsis sp. PD_33]
MLRKRRELREDITYSVVKEKEVNILHQLGYNEKQNQFFAHPRSRQEWMVAVVGHHLGLKSSRCHVEDEEHWLYGSFNVCVLITIDDWDVKRVLIRFPLPYRVGEATMHGNGDEKIGCEAGTYAWLQENCPAVPILRFYGVSLSTSETPTELEDLPILTRYPSVINDLGDYASQLAALSAMRTICPVLFQRDFRRGPFSFVFTDLHQSNIFVDAEWNITYLVDLEWACSTPIEMVSPPPWLTNEGVDEEDAEKYNAIRKKFMDILAVEERELKRVTPRIAHNSLPRLSDVMNQTWETGTFKYTLALLSPSRLFNIFH